MTIRRIMQLASLIVALGALVVWLATGASRQVWTTTTREIQTPDEVTGLTGITNEKRFTAGLDFLFGAWLAGSVLACSALLFGRKRKSTPEPEPSTP